MKIKGRYNRYLFLKEMNRKSIILIKGKDRYYTYDRDLDIVKYINFKSKYRYKLVLSINPIEL